ncbi:MAG TPA: PKD domain-containing protein [Kofleriaceae bacterium]|nr:PKD domain-containing protein [Kofleriaceae bacterium]
MRLRSAAAGASAVVAAAAFAAMTAAPACSCGGGEAASDAGPVGDGGIPGDAAAPADASAPLIWIDFSVTGCAAAGAGGEPCTGAAPLRLEFVPIAPAQVDFVEWSFGDGSRPDQRFAPDHVYTSPGVYDVSLFAEGPGGTAAVTRQALVDVSPGGLGGACFADQQCASGACVCGAEPCTGLASGFCSQPCAGAACGEGVCADLAPTAPPDPAPWQAPLCLADCGGGAECPGGTVCRELPGAGGGWVQGCFAAGLVGDIGDSCAGDGGAPDGGRCASGECLAEGLRGLCSAGCGDDDACPPSAACATFNRGGSPSCLARCDADTPCDADPWLACEPAGGTGGAGFTVDEPPSDGGYCAPRRCAGPDDCPLGRCQGGFCAPP